MDLQARKIAVVARSAICTTAPLGPSIRRYANAAAIVETTLQPWPLLDTLKDIERDFGRRARGRRWTARVIDCDIILWNGGRFDAPDLTVPHPQFRHRDFVLRPASEIAGSWRDPGSGLTIDHLFARYKRAVQTTKTAIHG